MEPGWRRFDRRLASSARVRIPRLASTTRAPACVRNPLCSTRSLPRKPRVVQQRGDRAALQSGAVLDLGCRPNFGLFSDCTAVPIPTRGASSFFQFFLSSCVSCRVFLKRKRGGGKAGAGRTDARARRDAGRSGLSAPARVTMIVHMCISRGADGEMSMGLLPGGGFLGGCGPSDAGDDDSLPRRLVGCVLSSMLSSMAEHRARTLPPDVPPPRASPTCPSCANSSSEP